MSTDVNARWVAQYPSKYTDGNSWTPRPRIASPSVPAAKGGADPADTRSHRSMPDQLLETTVFSGVQRPAEPTRICEQPKLASVGDRRARQWRPDKCRKYPVRRARRPASRGRAGFARRAPRQRAGVGRVQELHASVAHGEAVPALAKGQHDVDGKDQNILLLGNDSRAGAHPAELRALSTQDDGGSVNTDTMMVLHVPAGMAARRRVISFPRDSWVDIPGNGKAKINSAYGGGYVAAHAPRRDRARERRHQAADPHDQRAHRTAHRPLRPGEPARLLPHQQRDRRRRRLPDARPEPARPTPTSSATATRASTCPRGIR